MVYLAYILKAVGNPGCRFGDFKSELPSLSMQTYDYKALFIATDKE